VFFGVMFTAPAIQHAPKAPGKPNQPTWSRWSLAWFLVYSDPA